MQAEPQHVSMCTDGAPGHLGGPDALAGAAFSTTETFTTTRGFVVPAPSAAGSRQACRAAGDGASTSSSITSSSRSSRSSSAELARPAVPSAPGSGAGASAGGQQRPEAQRQSSTPVGWSGLLEISRSAGLAPGVVGSAACVGECEGAAQGHIEMVCTVHASHGVRRLVKSVIRGLKARQEPEAAREGMGGTYFFPNEAATKCAIFKPCDEEPLAPFNPKGYVGRALGDPGWKSTVRVGEAALREVAAYLLDHDHFAQVPHTVLVRAQHPLFNYTCHQPTSSAAAAGASAEGAEAGPGHTRSSSSVSMETCEPAWLARGGGECDGCSGSQRPLKLGSLQEFVYHIADTSEFGASRYRTRDVHAIGILDLRLFNTDRHAGNILVRQPVARAPASGGVDAPGLAGARLGLHAVAGGGYELIPIDHGFALPEALEAPFFEWLHWPQACLPFDEEELAYIARLDPQADVTLLQRELPNLRPECLRVLEVSTSLLQRCAAAGLSLADIGALASRPLDALEGDDSCPSELEKACVAARQAVETRELAAMLSSSCSSEGTFTLREEDEEGGGDSSSSAGPGSEDGLGLGCDEADELLSEAAASLGSSLRLMATHMQQQQAAAVVRTRPPSRLAVMSEGGAAGGIASQAPGIAAPSAAAAAAAAAVAAVAAPGAGLLSRAGVAGKSASSDLASVMSEGTVCGLATAMSLGSSGGGPSRPGGERECELLFELDEDSSGPGSAAATPKAAAAGSNARGAGAGAPPCPAAAAAEAAAGAAGDDARAAAAAAAGELQLSAFVGSQLAALGAGRGSSSSGGGAELRPCVQLVTAMSSEEPSLPTPSCVGGGAGGLLSPLGGQPGALARSMALGEGWAGFRELRAKAGAAGLSRCGGAKKASVAAAAAARRRTGLQRMIYPPPVVRAAPRSASEVLVGLSEAQWAAFMAELAAYMDEALKPGTGIWRGASQAAGLGAAAASCPRF